MRSTRSLLPDRDLATSMSLSEKSRLAGYQFHVDRYVAVELEGNDSLCGARWCLRGRHVGGGVQEGAVEGKWGLCRRELCGLYLLSG